MSFSRITYCSQRGLGSERHDQVLQLYQALAWSSAEKPERLFKALEHSHSVVTAWDGDRLVGLGNAISDGYLVVYYPHLCVHPEYQGCGIGKGIVERLQKRYRGFHQHTVLADGDAVGFYKKMGFAQPSRCVGLWIYDGKEHD